MADEKKDKIAKPKKVADPAAAPLDLATQEMIT